MGATMGKAVLSARSTGRVPSAATPTEHLGVADNSSTGAVPGREAAEVRADFHGAEAVVRYPTPGPVTITVGWLTEQLGAEAIQTKVIDPPAGPEVSPATQAETK